MHRQNKQTFWSKSIFSLDHKVIAKQFLFLGIFPPFWWLLSHANAVVTDPYNGAATLVVTW